MKPYNYDRIKPFYALYGKEDALQFHQNTDISAHNYGLDDREAAYQFLDEYFGIKASRRKFPLVNM